MLNYQRVDPKLWTKLTHGSDVRPCASASVQIDRTFTKLAVPGRWQQILVRLNIASGKLT